VTESQIVKRCGEGDREAQQELYAQTCDRIYRLLLRMTHNADDAAELTQETYLRVFRNIQQFDGKAHISTWIYRIAVNEGQQFLRRKKLHYKTMEQQEAPGEADSGDETADIQLDVREALDRLPETERVLLVLRYFENLNYNQMAEVLEKPPGTVASGLNRARQMLREILKPKSGSKD
jgi:RNA polymerase sigma-70 factor (ECF subfamily)